MNANEPKKPETPNNPEITEPKRYPIHPDIPEQPIHEPLHDPPEPTQTPVEGP